MKQQAVSSLMNNAKSSSAVAWVMMNEENYGLSNIPEWVASLNPPKDKAPPVELKLNTVNSAESVKDAIVDDATNSQEKATLYTREQLIEMGRISEEDDRKEQDTGDEHADPSNLSGVQQKAEPRSLYNQSLSTFRRNNGGDPVDPRERALFFH